MSQLGVAAATDYIGEDNDPTIQYRDEQVSLQRYQILLYPTICNFIEFMIK